MQFKYIVTLLITIGLSLNSFAKKWEWEPIAESDWQVDDSMKTENAVMIFEIITADDRKAMDDKVYYSIHRRIRILNLEGREWGDYTVPYFQKKQKIKEIYGRTVLPDGKEYYLDKSDIIESEVLKSKKFKIKQKSFSLPALSANCIVEYFVKYELPNPANTWVIQKDIPLLSGKFVWKFYKGKGLQGFIYSALSSIMTPNYLLLNTDREVDIKQLPFLKDPEEIVFSVTNESAFKSEPCSMPDIALKSQLRCYYGESGTPASFWGNRSKSIENSLKEFTSKDQKVRETIKTFGELATDNEKMKTAYLWLQRNLINTTYDESDEDFKENDYVDDILKHGYGSGSEINEVFYDMLREMNIDAKMAYTTDHDDNFFIYEAKYWQFDRSLIAIPAKNGKYAFYNPGGKYLPVGTVAWFNEGNNAFIVGDMNRQFYTVPISNSRSNRIERYQILNLNEDLNLNGIMKEKYIGHSARSIRLDLDQINDDEKIKKIKEQILGNFPNFEADSITVENIDSTESPVIINSSITVNSFGQNMGSMFLLKPFDLFSRLDNPFVANEREHAIMFDYAYEVLEVLKIEIPTGWRIEAMPSDSAFSNRIGLCEINFEQLNNRKTLSVQRIFKLNTPLIKASEYPSIRELYQFQKWLEDSNIILKREI